MSAVPVPPGRRYRRRVTAAPATPTSSRPGVAWPGLAALAAGVTLLLLAVAARYGPHRDEMYFLRAGREPAFGYVDQPPLTPLLAHAMDALFGGSLVGLRVPSALMAGLVVLLTGLLAREFGGGRGAQLIAAASTAVSSFLLAMGHLLSTTTVDLLVWTPLSWLVVRALRDGGAVWLAVGAVAGIGLENKLQPAFLLAGVLPGYCWRARGRRSGRGGRGWAGRSRSRSGRRTWCGRPRTGSRCSRSRRRSPPAARRPASPGTCSAVPAGAGEPVAGAGVGAGLVAARARPGARPWRAFALAYVLVVVVFMATGGKPYYVAGLYPVLLAAGAAPVRAGPGGARRTRRAARGGAGAEPGGGRVCSCRRARRR